MNQNECTQLLVALITGIACGLVFFGGLWWTVRKAVTASMPAVLFGVSFLVRMAIAMAGFYWASYGHWAGVMVCLAGFLAARIWVTRHTTPESKPKNTQTL